MKTAFATEHVPLAALSPGSLIVLLFSLIALDRLFKATMNTG